MNSRSNGESKADVPDKRIRIYMLSRLEFDKLSQVLVEVKNDSLKDTLQVPMKLAHENYQYLLVADFTLPQQQRKSRSDRTWFSYTFTVMERAVRFKDTNKHHFKYSQRIKFHKDPITPLTFQFGAMDIPFMFAISYGVHDMHFIEHLLTELASSKCTLDLAAECIQEAKKTQFFNARNLTDKDEEKLREYLRLSENVNDTIRALFIFYSITFSANMAPTDLSNLASSISEQNIELQQLVGARHLSEFDTRLSKLMKRVIASNKANWILLIPLWNALDIAVRALAVEPFELPQYEYVAFSDELLLHSREALGRALLADLQFGDARRFPLETVLFEHLPATSNGVETAHHLIALFSANPFKEHLLRNISETNECLPRLLFSPSGSLLKSQIHEQYRLVVPATAQHFQQTVRLRQVPNVVRGGHASNSQQITASGAENWTENEVCEWLLSLAPAYKQYESEFQDNGIDGETLLVMTEEDLEDMVKRPIHRKKILNNLEKLKALPPPPQPVVVAPKLTPTSTSDQAKLESSKSGSSTKQNIRKSSSNSSLDKLKTSKSRARRSQRSGLRKVRSTENMRKLKQRRHGRQNRNNSGENWEKQDDKNQDDSETKTESPTATSGRKSVRSVRQRGTRQRRRPVRTHTAATSKSPGQSPKNSTNNAESPSPKNVVQEASKHSNQTDSQAATTQPPEESTKGSSDQTSKSNKPTKSTKPTKSKTPTKSSGPKTKTALISPKQLPQKIASVKTGHARSKLSMEDCCHACGWGKMPGNTCCEKCGVASEDIELDGRWAVNRENVFAQVSNLQVVFYEGMDPKNMSTIECKNGQHYLNGWQMNSESNLEKVVWNLDNNAPVVWIKNSKTLESSQTITSTNEPTYKWVKITKPEVALGIRLKQINKATSKMQWLVTNILGHDAKIAGVVKGDLIVSVNDGSPPKNKSELIVLLKKRPLVIKFLPEPQKTLKNKLPPIQEGSRSNSATSDDTDLPDLEPRPEVEKKKQISDDTPPLEKVKNNDQLDEVPTHPWTEETFEGSVYYYNHDTGESVWEKPTTMADTEKVAQPSTKKHDTPSQGDSSSSSPPNTKPIAVTRVAPTTKQSGNIAKLTKMFEGTENDSSSPITAASPTETSTSNAESKTTPGPIQESKDINCANCPKNADLYCADCDVELCQSCSTMVHSIQGFDAHKRDPLSKQTTTNFLSQDKAPSPTNFLDKASSPSRSIRSPRRNKALQSSTKDTNNINCTLDKLQRRSQMIAIHSSNYIDRGTAISKEFKEKREEIRQRFNDAVILLQKQKSRLFKELQEEEQRVNNRLDVQRKPLEQFQSDLQSQQDELNTALQPEGDDHSLSVPNSVKKSELVLANSSDFDDIRLPEVLLNLTFDSDFEKHCQDFCIIESSIKNIKSENTPRKVHFVADRASPKPPRREPCSFSDSVSSFDVGSLPEGAANDEAAAVALPAQLTGERQKQEPQHDPEGGSQPGAIKRDVSLVDYLLGGGENESAKRKVDDCGEF